MNPKNAIYGLSALLLEIGLYLLIYILFASFIYGEFTPAETSTMQFVWYAFIVIAIISNIFDILLYLQLLVWGFVIKFTYNNEYSWLCIATLCIGLIAMTGNIIVRKHIMKSKRHKLTEKKGKAYE